MQSRSPWHSRGYLPHFDRPQVAQFITFRLDDALPQCLLEQWHRELAKLPSEQFNAEIRKRTEIELDRGHGECILRIPEVATIVENSLLHFHQQRYCLHAWVVMPNHVHALSTAIPPITLANEVHGWKSFTSHEIGKVPKRSGRIWQPEYFDRYIRDEEHFWKVVDYIEKNPVKAGLCKSPEEWPFSSARLRLADGTIKAAAGR